MNGQWASEEDKKAHDLDMILYGMAIDRIDEDGLLHHVDRSDPEFEEAAKESPWKDL